MATSKTLSQLRLLWTRRLRVRPRVCTQVTAQQKHHLYQYSKPPLRLSCAAMRRRCFMTASSDFEASASLLQRVIAEENEDDAAIGDSAISSGDGRLHSSTTTSNSSSGAEAGTGGVFSMRSNREGGEFAVDTLPALKVLSETFALVKKSPAFQNWSSTDWLLGLTGRACAFVMNAAMYTERTHTYIVPVVLAQHNTIQRKKRNVLSVLSDDTNRTALKNQVGACGIDAYTADNG